MDHTHTKERMVSFVLTPSEKRALKIIAAESDMTISEYLRKLLYRHTAITERALTIHKIKPQ